MKKFSVSEESSCTFCFRFFRSPLWLTQKTLRNWFQFPFMKKDFLEVNIRAFVETTPPNVTVWKPETTR